jgi:hypothetical protein
MRHASGSLSEYQNAGTTGHEADPHFDDQKVQIAGWGPAVFFAAMVIIMMISAVLVTAISSR